MLLHGLEEMLRLKKLYEDVKIMIIAILLMMMMVIMTIMMTMIKVKMRLWSVST